MLFVVLILVLAALGGVVTALITADSLWAWVSIGLSVLGLVVLLVDMMRRRAARRAEPKAEPTDEESASPDAEAADDEHPEQTALIPARGELAGEPAEDPEAEPAEEETDAADLLIVSTLDAEVVVVDERPRYHLASCPWLGDRDTIPIVVAEARELGFTPCARCGPDAELAAKHREERESVED